MHLVGGFPITRSPDHPIVDITKPTCQESHRLFNAALPVAKLGSYLTVALKFSPKRNWRTNMAVA